MARPSPQPVKARSNNSPIQHEAKQSLEALARGGMNLSGISIDEECRSESFYKLGMTESMPTTARYPPLTTARAAFAPLRGCGTSRNRQFDRATIRSPRPRANDAYHLRVVQVSRTSPLPHAAVGRSCSFYEYPYSKFSLLAVSWKEQR